MSTRQLNLNDFAAHCLDEMKAVQEGDTVIEILSNGGKVIAVVNPAPVTLTAPLPDWPGVTGGCSSLDQPALVDAAAAQDFRHDLSAAQCAALQGTPIVRSVADFYGDGTAAEWEGFDEALEQWRLEPLPTGGPPHAA